MRFRTKSIKFFVLFCLLFVAGFLFLTVLPVEAQNAPNFGLEPVGQNIGLGTADIRLTIARIIRVALGFLGIVAIGMGLYGGFMYMTAGGEEDRVTTGKKIIINSVIGLAIILSAFAIATFVINKLADATGTKQAGIGPCADETYAQDNPEVCDPEGWGKWCDEHPDSSFCCEKKLAKDKVFIAKSLSPVTDNTRMNNVSVRVLFNAPLKSGQSAENALRISNADGQLGSAFQYRFLTNNRNENIGVEAEYSNPEKKCSDGTPCIESGDYRIDVSDSLIGVFDGEDRAITTSTSCGNYPLSAGFAVGTNGVKDESAPDVSEMKINGQSGNNIKLRSGKIYTIQSNISDLSGFGFLKFNIEKETKTGGKQLVYSDLFGPTVDQTSNATEAKPYKFVYPGLSAGLIEEMQKYTITVQAWDIDHNSRTVSVDIEAFPDHCFNGVQDQDKGETGVDVGGSCAMENGGDCDANWQCDSGVCSNGKCVSSPIILDVLPMDGAAGNWISILGKYFNATGSVQFGIKPDGSDSISSWVNATVVNCAGKPAWGNNYVVAEVPSNVDLPLNSQSAIKISTTHSLHAYATTTADLSGNNNHGIRAGGIELGIGHLGEAFVFNGVNAYVGKALTVAIPKNGPLTLSGWYNFSKLPAPGESMYLNSLLRYQDGKIFLGDSKNYFALGSEWSVNNWKQVVLAYDGDVSTARLFVNGVWYSPQIVSSTDFSPVSMLVVGGGLNAVENKDLFAGTIDEVVLTNSRVADGDIGNIATASDRILYWPFESVGEGTFFDTTIDQKGPKPGSDGYFRKNEIVRPGLCNVRNLTSAVDLAGVPNDNIRAEGVLFGSTAGKLLFGGIRSAVDGYLTGGVEAVTNGWTSTQIGARVPDNMSSDSMVVYVESADKKKSNGLPFVFDNGNIDLTPVIESIDPATTTPLSFVTLRGKGFGASGSVFVNESQSALKTCFTNSGASGCYRLSTTLPEYCGVNWHNNEVVVQVPVDLVSNTEIKSFYVGLINNFGRISQEKVTLGVDGTVSSSPSICKINPNYGPAPLPTDHEGLSIFGVNLANVNVAYFYRDANNWLTTLAGSNFGPGTLTQVLSDTQIKTKIPVDGSGRSMRTGPIKVGTNGGAQVSNGLNYNVIDCREKDAVNPYGDNYRCCAEGPEAGLWKDNMFTCEGETRTGGYVWRFTTGRIPNLPRVLENCDAEAWSMTSTENFSVQYPSPTPWEKWKDGKNTCTNAQVSLQFNMGMLGSTINSSTVKMYVCGEKSGAIDCVPGSASTTEITNLNPVLESGNTLIIGNGSELTRGRWYRVVLTDKILSDETVLNPFGSGIARNEKLLRTRPCGQGTAYCFDFKTGQAQCTLKNAAINPPRFVSDLLGILQDKRGAPVMSDLFNDPPVVPSYFNVWGLANQECVTMNVDGMGWRWDGYSPDLVSSAVRPLINKYTDSRGIAIAHKATPPVGVDIFAEANIVVDTALTTRLFKPVSRIVVDLGDPKVIDYWPKCVDACVNATVGVRFNQEMDKSAYAESAVVYECADEMCLSKELFGGIEVDPTLSDSTSITLSLKTDYLFATNTWYLVEVASSSLRAVIGYNPDNSPLFGKGMKDPFVFKFRTKKDATPCLVSRVVVEPAEHVSYLIGEKTTYIANPFSAPDKCSDSGQKLDPWSYGWEWASKDRAVATISTLQSGGSPKSYCTKNCLLSGSVLSGNYGIFAPLCGNGMVDDGEDCDIALAAEIPGISCSLNCLRAGNANISTVAPNGCGDGMVSSTLGEECDPGIPNQAKYCDQYCRWKGVTRTPPTSNASDSWCGSDSVTLGEECDTGELSTSRNGCTQNCLHGGTPLALGWCLNHKTLVIGEKTVGEITNNCGQAFSVCGNGQIEPGEQCEVGLASSETLMVVDGGFVSIKDARNYCDNKCRLKNLCDIDLYGSRLKCTAGSPGCNSDCTLAGSSLLGSSPSFCGDGIVAPGEWADCESDGLAVKSGNPVQIAESVGESDIVNSDTKQQETELSATANVLRVGSDVKNLSSVERRSGLGKYAVQCGFVENNDGENNCFNNADGQNNYGVGDNSCCYERPRREAEYPIDGAGIRSGTTPVCPNSYVEVAFGGEIDEKTIDGSIMIARAIDTNNSSSTCSDLGENDVTDLVESTMGEPEIGLVARVWNFVHDAWIAFVNIFRRIIGMPALATMQDLRDADNIWCSGGVPADKNVSYIYDDNNNVIFTVVGLYPKKMFAKSSYYAV
ncbi:MAG TPA: hypothetical protein PLV72_03860, partial [Candidatus Magasanikbacteria bacterium]|nr:hypothetical protein [Candidatus Magasanikbacteria bacterium]